MTKNSTVSIFQGIWWRRRRHGEGGGGRRGREWGSGQPTQHGVPGRLRASQDRTAQVSASPQRATRSTKIKV